MIRPFMNTMNNFFLVGVQTISKIFGGTKIYRKLWGVQKIWGVQKVFKEFGGGGGNEKNGNTLRYFFFSFFFS